MPNVSLTGGAYTQNFDSLATTGTSSTTPNGFLFLEAGTAAEGTYAAGNGSSTTGNTYSFGMTNAADRAFGTLLSSSLSSTIGAFFTNDSGATITSVTISFTGEQWRLGALNRVDRLDFAYRTAAPTSAVASDLAAGTWTEFDPLDFTAPVTAGTVGVLDGNLAANRVSYTTTITGLDIAAGVGFGIRWVDFNAAGSDDGLAVDDFSLTFNGGATPAAPTVSIGNASVIEGDAGVRNLIFTVTRSDTSSAFTVDYRSADGTATTADGDYTAISGTLTFAAGGAASQTISVPIIGDTRIEGNETLSVMLSGLVNSVGSTTLSAATGTGTITNDDANLTPIYAIQGSPQTQTATGGSMLAGQTITTRGVVTARDTNGYYIQDASGDGDTKTSDAILVYTASAPAADIVVGAIVQVTGQVTEFASTGAGAGAPTVTEIVNSSALVVGTAAALPAAVTIGSGAYIVPNDIPGALALFESLEGMRVTVPTPLVVGPTTTSGEIVTVANLGAGSGATDRGNLLLTGGATTFGNTNTVGGDFQPDRLFITSGLGVAVPGQLNVGAVLNDVTGILGQGYGSPEIQATQAVTVQTPSTLVKTGSSLQGSSTQLLVASYNAENLDPGDGTARFAAVAGEIVNYLKAPGIISMQEVQDNNGPTDNGVTSASTTLQMLADAIKQLSGITYAVIDNTFINNDTNGGEPGGNIRVAYLYRPDIVSLVPGSLRTIAANGAAIADQGSAIANAAANSDQATNANNPFNGSRPPLAAEFVFLANNEHLTVVNNHFTSKGGSAFTTGTIQPPLNAGEVQRAAQAQAVNTFVDGLLNANPGARVIVTGDLNEYEFEEPLKVLKGVATVSGYNGAGQGTATYTPGGAQVLIDLQDQLPAAQRYDYVFDGVSQTLDHMLASNALVNAGITFQPVHINAEFYNQTSDHDPLVALFTINEMVAPTLVATSPLDNATAVAPGANVVLTFSEAVKAGTGNIVLRPTGGGADVVIAVSDTSQIAFSGVTLTINPTNDLRGGAAYDVIVASGVVTDLAGNAFAGIAVDALDFTITQPPVTGDNGSGSGGGYIPGAYYGTEGGDIIIATFAGEVLVGNGGNDTYLVNSPSDQVIEANGGGTDIVYTTVSYNLGSNEVEALSVANQMTTNAINLVGNYASQTIAGNYGDNLLNGGSGADTLIGLFGNDTYAVGDSRIVVQEQVGQGFDTLVTSIDYRLGAGVSIELFAAQDRSSTTGLNLAGNELAQTIAGTAGADTINGGGGMDTLIGGAGADTFAISVTGQGNVAVLADFQAGTDRITLASAAFAAIGPTLEANEFVTGTAATTVDQYIIYNQATGQLFYDADGSGSGAAVLFAQVAPNTAITAATLTIV